MFQIRTSQFCRYRKVFNLVACDTMLSVELTKSPPNVSDEVTELSPSLLLVSASCGLRVLHREPVELVLLK